ncbi:MAG TPA: cation:proton antiporter [Candidatus Limnocylindria bacterium]|nr:cation:proton antiporter [Candidatus Limnocylindria bacterium]
MESVEHAASILTQLFVLLVATKIGDEIFKRLGQPTVVGEILGGVIVGPALLNLYQVSSETALFAEIGVVLLLFKVGLDTRLHELMSVGRSALLVATLGVVFPLVAGFGIAEMLGAPLQVALFLGAALTATSVGITSKVLDEIHGLHTVSGRVILGAAVADDVLGLVILAVASGVAQGNVSPGRILTLLLLSVAFIVIVVVGGTRILRRRRSLLTVPQFAESPFLPGMIIMLGLAALSASIGLAAIIGSFLAGMVVGESSEKEALDREVAPVAAFFTPFFFGFIGAQVDLAGLGSMGALGLLLGVTLIAVIAKFIGAFLGSIDLGRRRATTLGWGLVPRGEVGIVVAGLGLTTGAIDGELYSVVIGMAVLTTLIVPPLLPRLLQRSEPPEELVAAPDDDDLPQPAT